MQGFEITFWKKAKRKHKTYRDFIRKEAARQRENERESEDEREKPTRTLYGTK